MTIILKEQSAKGRQTLEPEKVHSIGELLIAAKFSDHWPSVASFSL